ncbi:MAG: hypothetical protein EXS05_01595 [Planctomycetaceae bacterium]|nr:hypothetical protein [Planctomycetaceae bacterium]
MHGNFVIFRSLLMSLVALSAGRSFALADPIDVLPEQNGVRIPQPFQVIQRQGYEPARAHEHQPGGPVLGFADVPVAARLPRTDVTHADYRVVPLADAYGRGTDWTAVEGKTVDDEFVASVRIAAGGWYRLELRTRKGDALPATAHVQPIGVGEVLIVAGQSYAEGANDELLKVEERHGRVTAYDVAKKSWRIAHDPQPNTGTGGTIWPPLGDMLVPLLRVPVGFVNVAVGGTASRQWLPGETLYQNLAAAGKTTGRFRAVLWQQGESDVIEKVSTETYVKHLTAIRAELANEWDFEPPWLLAKSTLHPTVYNDPAGEGKIRAAIDELCRLPGFRPGPDTDTLGGENRGGPMTRRHFSGIGQRRAALLWFAALWPEIQRESTRP